jgi:hypothetical protein
MEKHHQEVVFLILLTVVMVAALLWSSSISNLDPSRAPDAPTPASDNTAMPLGRTDMAQPQTPAGQGHVPAPMGSDAGSTLSGRGAIGFWPLYAAPWRPLPIGVNTLPIIALPPASDAPKDGVSGA